MIIEWIKEQMIIEFEAMKKKYNSPCVQVAAMEAKSMLLSVSTAGDAPEEVISFKPNAGKQW